MPDHDDPLEREIEPADIPIVGDAEAVLADDDPLEREIEPADIPVVGGPEANHTNTKPLEAVKGRAAAQPGAPVDQPVLLVTHRSETGPVRDHNEDACVAFAGQSDGSLVTMPVALLVVADGMGGHFGGQEASRLAARLVASQILSHIVQPMLQAQDLSAQAPVQDVLIDAVQSANYQIHNPHPEHESGTTLTAALIIGRRLFLAHVGDSRAYLLTNGELTQLTKDHSFIQRLQETGQLSPMEAASHPQRNVLYRAVGQGPGLDVDTSTRQLPASGQLLVCSDGLWGLVSETLIQETLCRQDLTIAERNDRLVEAAIAAGGYDNITSVLASFSW